MEIMTLKKPQRATLPLPPSENRAEESCPWTTKQTLTRHWLCRYLDHGTSQPPELWETHVCCFKPQSVGSYGSPSSHKYLVKISSQHPSAAPGPSSDPGFSACHYPPSDSFSLFRQLVIYTLCPFGPSGSLLYTLFHSLLSKFTSKALPNEWAASFSFWLNVVLLTGPYFIDSILCWWLLRSFPVTCCYTNYCNGWRAHTSFYMCLCVL